MLKVKVMKLYLRINNSGIISGDTVRELITIFPELKERFKQRKTFDEYHFYDTEVVLTLNKLELLNENDFEVIIGGNEMYIND